MTRNRLAVVLVAIAFLSAAWAADDQESKAKVDLKKMKATIERLESPVTLDFVETPLTDVLKFLKDLSGIELDPEQTKLPDKAIEITVQGEPLAVAIQKILDQCAWTYAVRPDGNVLVRPVVTKKK
jgi:hypothetical protein